MSRGSEGEEDSPFYSYKTVSQWDCEEVIIWMRGLNDTLSQHIPQFQAHSITGADLLKLSRQQLEYLKVTQVGHQELFLEAVELLSSVDNARSRHSTVTLTSSLSKKTSQLMKALSLFKRKQSDDDESSLVLSCMEAGAAVLQAANFLTGWLDRFPSELIEDYTLFRKQLLQCSHSLSSTMDGDELDASRMNEACTTILKLTSGMMSPEHFSKEDPVYLTSVTLVPDAMRVGFSIQRTRHGALVIVNIQPGTPADRCEQIVEGVELVQINEQNVVCWEVKNVVKCLKACGDNITLILRVSKLATKMSTSSTSDDLEGEMEISSSSDKSPPTKSQKIRSAGNLRLPLDRVPSSPAVLERVGKPRVTVATPQAASIATSPMVPFDSDRRDEVANGWEGQSGEIIKRKSRSLSDSSHPSDYSDRRSLGTQSPETIFIKKPIAYRTAIIGGVVHKIPIQEDIGGASSTAKKKAGSFKKKVRVKEKEKERSHSVTSPMPRTPPTPLSPTSTNEGGDLDSGRAVFSDPTEVFIEGKTAKQITVSSGTEFSRDTPLRNSGKKTSPELMVPCFQLKNPDHEGWVNKLGGSGFTPRNWRKRWFVLKDRKIYYYKTSFDIAALGIVDLAGYKVEQAPELKKKNGFRAVKSGARTYSFFTETVEEMLRWIELMNEASQEISQEVSQVSSSEHSSDVQTTESHDEKSDE